MLIERLEAIFDEELVFTEMTASIKRKKQNKYIKQLISEKEVVIPILAIASGNYGVYVFIENINDAYQVRSYLLHKFKMRDSMFVFAETETGGVYYDDESRECIYFEHFYEGVANFRQNHMIPECVRHKYHFKEIEDYFENVYEPLENEEDENDLYIRPLVSNSKLEEIDEILQNIEEEPVIEGKYMIYPDGSMRVKKFVSQGLVGGSEVSFPCCDEPTEKTFWCTALFGWLGFHKFLHGKWGQGLLYLVTCGFMGILPLFDLLSMIIGDYHYTDVNYDMGLDRKINKTAQRIYFRPLQKKWLGILGLVLAIGVAFIAFNFIYQPVIAMLGDLFAMLAENLNADDVENIVNNMPIQ
jgi:TM2 domain-containing membrane protein YozV